MNVQVSRRGKEYVETARTLLRTAQTMTDRLIASRLQALADDYQRRAEKASHDDAARASARSANNSAELSDHMTGCEPHRALVRLRGRSQESFELCVLL